MLPYGRKNPLPFPFSQRSHVGNLRQTIQGKGVIHKRVETAGVYPLVRPRGVSADVYPLVPLPGRQVRFASHAENPAGFLMKSSLSYFRKMCARAYSHDKIG